MRIISDLHTHTLFSHGSGSVEDNVRAALDRGLCRIAITDHADTHLLYGVKRGYLDAIEECRAKYAGKIEVLCGIEANLTALSGRRFEDRLSPYDIVVLGYHKLARYDDMRSALHFYIGNTLLHRSAGTVNKNTEAYINAIAGGRITTVAHPDYGCIADWERIAPAAVAAGTALEINSRNIRLAPQRYKELARLGVKFTVSSDAHDPGRVGDFAAAVRLIEEAGLCASDITNAEED